MFGEQTIAYIDLDLYIERSSTERTVFEVASSPALHKLIQQVLHQVFWFFFLFTFENNWQQIKFLTPIHLYLLLYHKRTNSGINFEIHQVPHPEDKQFTIADWQYDQPVNPFVSHGNQIIRNTLHSQGTVVISVGYSVQQIKVCVRKIRKIVLSLY